MDCLTYTLLSDGSSNKVLLPVITWLLQNCLPAMAIQGEWADLRKLPVPPSRANIPERIRVSLELYPCDVLFIHRDAETAPIDKRIAEIECSVSTARSSFSVPPTIPIVPIRMLEAWFLFDLPAIKRAAGNPSGGQSLELPPLASVESIPNPKDILHNLLREASELHGRRLKAFNPQVAFHRIPGFIDDFEPLRSLQSFRMLEQHIQQAIDI